MYLLAILYLVKVSFILDDNDNDERVSNAPVVADYQHHAPCNLQFCLLALFVSKHKLHDDCVTYYDARPVIGISCSWICELQHQHLYDVMRLRRSVSQDKEAAAAAAHTLSCQHPPTTCDFLLLHYIPTYMMMMMMMIHS